MFWATIENMENTSKTSALFVSVSYFHRGWVEKTVFHIWILKTEFCSWKQVRTVLKICFLRTIFKNISKHSHSFSSYELWRFWYNFLVLPCILTFFCFRDTNRKPSLFWSMLKTDLLPFIVMVFCTSYRISQRCFLCLQYSRTINVIPFPFQQAFNANYLQICL